MAATTEVERQEAPTKVESKKRANKVLTRYVVLRQDDRDSMVIGEVNYRELPGTFEAHNKTAAMKLAAEGRSGSYRAVPESSWRGGVRITVETVEKVTVEELD